MRALDVGHTVELRPTDWFGREPLTLTIEKVRRNDAGIWLEGVDEYGSRWRSVLIAHAAEPAIETRWLAAGNLPAG